jgi:hypothetical protein
VTFGAALSDYVRQQQPTLSHCTVTAVRCVRTPPVKHELSYGLKFVTLNESLIRSFRQATTSISADELSRQLVQGLRPAVE